MALQRNSEPSPFWKQPIAIEKVLAPERGGATPIHPRWYVARVRSNFEKQSALLLCDTFEVWIPTVLRRTPRHGTTAARLFPGYLFIRMPPDPASLLRVAQCSGVIGLLGFKHRLGGEPEPEPVPDHQVESLRTMLTLSPGAVEVHPSRGTKAGSPVRVLAGPMRGMTGRFIRAKGRSAITIAVDLLGREASVSIDAEDVELLSDSKSAAA